VFTHLFFKKSFAGIVYIVTFVTNKGENGLIQMPLALVFKVSES